MQSDKTYHHGDLRRALVDAATQVAAERGLDAIKVSTLARQLGVSSGAPFRHFANREALLVAMAEAAADRQLAAMRSAAVAHKDPIEQQRRMGVAYVRWAVADPGGFRALNRAASIAGSERLRAQQQAFADTLTASLDNSRARLALADEPARVLAARALVHGLARMCVDGLMGRPISPDMAEQLAERVTRSIHFKPLEDHP